MAKHKKSKLMKPKKKRLPKLEREFTCPFCTHQNAISVKMDRERNMSELHCRVCGVTYTSAISRLDEPVDVFSNWIDQCQSANEKAASMAVKNLSTLNVGAHLVVGASQGFSGSSVSRSGMKNGNSNSSSNRHGSAETHSSHSTTSQEPLDKQTVKELKKQKKKKRENRESDDDHNDMYRYQSDEAVDEDDYSTFENERTNDHIQDNGNHDDNKRTRDEYENRNSDDSMRKKKKGETQEVVSDDVLRKYRLEQSDEEDEEIKNGKALFGDEE